MQPYESSDIGMYELERERIKRRHKFRLIAMDYDKFKHIKHHKDCVHNKYRLGSSISLYPCHPDCELPE